MIHTTRYYEEFLRYSKMAKIQQQESNLGDTPHKKGSIKDPLMKNVLLYDVVERRYAGFTQILLDVWYGRSKDHPYLLKAHDIRLPIMESFHGWRAKRSLPEILYLFMVHRLTGSGINYAKSPSGYHNTVIPELYKGETIVQMAKIIQNFKGTKYTSVGYQFPAFPKPEKNFTRGGDYFICTMLPKIINDFSTWLVKGGKKDLREIGAWLFQRNAKLGLRAYKFQYAAFISDLADFYPEYVNPLSPFYYGSNAIECLNYMAEPGGKLRGEKLLDAIMDKAVADTGYAPYNVEDQMCDCIRWIENYIRPGSHYDHLDRDAIWSTSKITDHPFGRQRAMLHLGLVQSFNQIDRHPSDDYVISKAGLTAEEYRAKVKSLS
jgi:hypothetical protein